ncbi:hypothetical protein [Algoriphagus namhaensis]
MPIIAKHYGKLISLKEIREISGRLRKEAAYCSLVMLQRRWALGRLGQIFFRKYLLKIRNILLGIVVISK